MNKSELSLYDVYPIIKEKIEKENEVIITVLGVSMQPMLYNHRDTVTIVRPKLPLKKYDLPLFKMDDNTFVLHRVININPDGTYECRGDNRWESEDNIRDDQIIGVVKSFNRNGKQIDVDKSLGYWFYTRTWKILHPFKKYYKYRKLSYIKNRIIGKIKSIKKRNLKLNNILNIERKSKNQIDFSGVISNVKKIGLNPKTSNGYEPCYDMPEIFMRLNIKETDCLIDLGCGKGYAMYKFADFPFCKIAGLEISEKLLRTAERNLKYLFPDDKRFIFYHTDVLNFKDFDDYNYIFMYNPFPKIVLEKVLENLKESLKRKPRELTVIYQNPQFGNVLSNDKTFKKSLYFDGTAIYKNSL